MESTLERDTTPPTRPGANRGTLLVVSHPNVATLNQTIYLRMVELGWDVRCVVPARWKDEYRPGGFTPAPLPGLESRVELVPIALPGKHQRHFYLTRPWRYLARWRPDVAFLEQEPFSVPALQWGLALRAAGIPFGLQADENLDRPFPWPAKAIRAFLLPRTPVIAARSPRAGEIARQWGATGRIEVVPHTVPDWNALPRHGDRRFTIGFAGRLRPEKGVQDLHDACAQLGRPARLLVVGDGPLRDDLERRHLPDVEVEVRTGLTGDAVRDAIGEMDLLVLPSRTTSTWAEQFGRVLVEAMLCGRPVIGSDSGEIPWVIEETGGGRLFPEGDVRALATTIRELMDTPAERARLAEQGRAAASRVFGVDAAAAALDGLLRPLLERGVND